MLGGSDWIGLGYDGQWMWDRDWVLTLCLKISGMGWDYFCGVWCCYPLSEIETGLGWDEIFDMVVVQGSYDLIGLWPLFYGENLSVISIKLWHRIIICTNWSPWNRISGLPSIKTSTVVHFWVYILKTGRNRTTYNSNKNRLSFGKICLVVWLLAALL